MAKRKKPDNRTMKEWKRRFDEAEKKARNVGVANAEGEPLLACFCAIMAFSAGAVSPLLLFRGAVLKGVSANELRKLSPIELGDLQFYEPEEDE